MNKPFNWPVRVYYEDTDAGGVVFYANYLKFLERARTELLRAKGFEQDDLMTNEGIVFAVRSLSIEYLKPADLINFYKLVQKLSNKKKPALNFSNKLPIMTNFWCPAMSALLV